MLHCNVKPDERVTVWNAPDGHDFLTIKILQTPDVLRPRLDIRPWRHNQRCHSGAQYIVVPLIGPPHRRPSNCNRHALVEREGEIHDTRARGQTCAEAGQAQLQYLEPAARVWPLERLHGPTCCGQAVSTVTRIHHRRAVDCGPPCDL